ncbi:hypothetical protein D9756_006591 [Leucocoprinus leucothites]|uniref:Uncharacterized protein n=1 Tax=Leucocoprinus leucothites TaxID=201217 RepID=A0A8H5G2J1_9AGAR|nr:hypothetical protein D9756_006591 [Leucoagaricus leucothites]
MSILSRVRTRSNPSSPKSKGKAPAPPMTTNTDYGSSDTSSDGSARLTVGGIANIFIKLRHLERQSKRPHTIACTSGPEPLTHPRAQANSQQDSARVMLGHKDNYVCAGNGGVDVVRLLRATRSAIVEQATTVGANALVDERWSYVINQPKHRPRGQYKISVQYTASAISANCRDTPHPVAMDKIQSIPGLMTVISRNVKYRTLIRKPAPMPANPVILSIMSLEHTPKPVDTNSPEPL